MRHRNFQVLNGHAFDNGALHANQPDTELIFQRLAHSTNTSVAQVIDIVNRSDPVTQITMYLTTEITSSSVNSRLSSEISRPNF